MVIRRSFRFLDGNASSELTVLRAKLVMDPTPCTDEGSAMNSNIPTALKKKKKKQIVPSRNSITSRACLVSLLLGFPFRLFFFPYHPMKMWRLSRGGPAALGPEVGAPALLRRRTRMGRTIPARSAGDRDPQTTQYFLLTLSPPPQSL